MPDCHTLSHVTPPFGNFSLRECFWNTFLYLPCDSVTNIDKYKHFQGIRLSHPPCDTPVTGCDRFNANKGVSK
jgi:hypothetical protein